MFLLFSNFLSPNSSDNLWGNSYIPCLLLIITLRFTCGEKKVYKFAVTNYEIASKCYNHDCIWWPIIKCKIIYRWYIFIFVKPQCWNFANKLYNDFYKTNNQTFSWKISSNPDPSKQVQEVIFSRKTRNISHLSLRSVNRIVSQSSDQK